MALLQVSAQVLALISQHATNGQCEKTSYDDFYLEVLPDAAKLTASDAWFPPNNVDLHILGGIGFNALPPILKWVFRSAQDSVLAVASAMHIQQCRSV